jgi:thioredoxin-related protein
MRTGDNDEVAIQPHEFRYHISAVITPFVFFFKTTGSTVGSIPQTCRPLIP